MKKFEEIWKEANEEADLKYDPKGVLARSLFLYSALKERIEPFLEKQQPEIPEVVAELIKYAKENRKTIRWCLYGNCKDLYPQAAEWMMILNLLKKHGSNKKLLFMHGSTATQSPRRSGFI